MTRMQRSSLLQEGRYPLGRADNPQAGRSAGCHDAESARADDGKGQGIDDVHRGVMDVSAYTRPCMGGHCGDTGHAHHGDNDHVSSVHGSRRSWVGLLCPIVILRPRVLHPLTRSARTLCRRGAAPRAAPVCIPPAAGASCRREGRPSPEGPSHMPSTARYLRSPPGRAGPFP